MYNVGGSEIMAREMDSLLSSSTFRYQLPEFAKTKEMIQLEPYNYIPAPAPAKQQTSNLTRYQSAPSSFLASLVNDCVGSVTVGGDYPDQETSNLGSEMIFPARFDSGDSRNMNYSKSLKQEYSDSVNLVYAPNRNSVGSVVENSFRSLNSSSSGGVENLNQVKNNISIGNRASLLRQNSSPAGFLSNLADEIGFVGASNKTSNYMNFSSGPSSQSRFLPQIAENVNENIGSRNDGYLANGQNGGHRNSGYLPNFLTDSTSNKLKRNRDGELKIFTNMNGLEMQNDDSKHHVSGLVHQLSLPSTSTEMATMENYLQFQQDSTPCKIRAKRGFATHPRSIAERVRRTRISERMKKLQDLFPNMDKQANTADMLDLAVLYIKDLQKEVQILNKTRAKCTCPSIKNQSAT